MASLSKVIQDSYVHAVLSTVRMHDLDRFNSENNLQLEAYPLAAFGCMLLSARHVPPRTPIELIFDRVEKVKSKLDKAQTYADSDPHWKDDCDSVGTTSLAKGLALEKVLPMQAADIVAWEFRKQQDRIGT